MQGRRPARHSVHLRAAQELLDGATQETEQGSSRGNAVGELRGSCEEAV